MMTPSPASISAAWNEWQALGGNSAIIQNNINSMEAISKIVHAAFERMTSDGHIMIRSHEEEPPRKKTERFLNSTEFEGMTRTLGEGQGYRPLYIADINVPMDADGDKLQPMMASIWSLTENDVYLLAQGHGIQFTLYGNQHPPMALQITADPIRDDADYTGANDG